MKFLQHFRSTVAAARNATPQLQYIICHQSRGTLSHDLSRHESTSDCSIESDANSTEASHHNETGWVNRYNRVDPQRFKKVSLERSIEYMKSGVFYEVYRQSKDGVPFWTSYRRNFKGHIAPKLRHSCYFAGKLIPNPCPVCRDPNIYVHEEHTELMKHFYDPVNLQCYEQKKMQICGNLYFHIKVCIEKAYNKGIIERPVPFVEFNYDEIARDIADEENRIKN